MNILDRYIGKTILQTIGIVLLAIAGVEIFIMMISELGDIGRNHYTIFAALWYVLLNLPDALYQFFPMVGLIGMLMGFGLLANHSELIVMQTAGLSPIKITVSALKTLFLLLVVVSVLGEIVAPKANVYSTHYKAEKMQGAESSDAIAYDLWFRMGNDFFYVWQVDRQNALHQIRWYHFDDHSRLQQASMAKQAEYHDGQWVAQQMKQTVFNTHAVSENTQLAAVIPLQISPNLLLQSTQSPSDLSLHALHQTLQFHERNHAQNDSVSLFFWRRILQPAASLVMMLLAIPCIFGPLRRATNSLRLVIGIVIGFCFYYLNAFFGPVVLLLHWPPLLGALLPTLIFGMIGLVLLRCHPAA